MSEYAKIPVGKEVDSFEVSQQFDVYSGIEIVGDDGNTTLVGNETGRVITIPSITAEQAQAILANLDSFQYQPYTATRALLNPAAEIGDGVTINGVYSGIYKMSKSFSPLMGADIEAPHDEEVDHEYPYESKQDRIYKREIAESKAQIKVNQESIAAEVERATASEGTLRSAITQTATDIRADVVSKTGGSTSSFGWALTDSSWTLSANGSTVFKATSAGIDVAGRITAKSGFIGNGANGFTIPESGRSFYNGMTSLSDTSHNGVYIGYDGIALGAGKFKVTSSGAVTASNLSITGGSITIGSNFSVNSSGNVTANNIKLTGKLNIGGTDISAATLRSGAQNAYNWSTNGTTTNWTNGYNYGSNYNNATKSGTNTYPAYFRCGTLTATLVGASQITLPAGQSFLFAGNWVSWKEFTINGTKINYLGR